MATTPNLQQKHSKNSATYGHMIKINIGHMLTTWNNAFDEIINCLIDKSVWINVTFFVIDINSSKKI